MNDEARLERLRYLAMAVSNMPYCLTSFDFWGLPKWCRFVVDFCFADLALERGVTGKTLPGSSGMDKV